MSAKTNEMSGKQQSIISADLKVTGDIRCDGDIQVDGTVEGDVKAVTMTVGPEASVRGSILADKIDIHGSVDGETKANSVRITRTANVTGGVIHEDLSIEPGAYLDGLCRRIEP
ncbi:MAG: polymer-forming cytoskeletal protein [Alphaproteobacteria bacterium]